MLSHYSEVKWVRCVGKVDSGCSDWEAEIGNGIDWEDSRLRNLESFVVGILDFEGKIVEGHAVKGELECLDYGTCGFPIVLIRASVSQGEGDRGGVSVSVSDFVLGLGEDGYEEDR